MFKVLTFLYFVCQQEANPLSTYCQQVGAAYFM